MGSLKSAYNWSGREIGGVILGESTTDVDGSYLWDGPAVPGGVIDNSGNVVTSTLGEIVAPQLAPPAPPVTAAEVEAGVTKLEIVTVDGKDELVAYEMGDKVFDLKAIEVQYETVKVDLVELESVSVKEVKEAEAVPVEEAAVVK